MYAPIAGRQRLAIDACIPSDGAIEGVADPALLGDRRRDFAER